MFGFVYIWVPYMCIWIYSGQFWLCFVMSYGRALRVSSEGHRCGKRLGGAMWLYGSAQAAWWGNVSRKNIKSPWPDSPRGPWPDSPRGRSGLCPSHHGVADVTWATCSAHNHQPLGHSPWASACRPPRPRAKAPVPCRRRGLP